MSESESYWMLREGRRSAIWDGGGEGSEESGEGGRGKGKLWGGRTMRTWAPGIANGQISHGQRRYPIVTANAGRPFVTGARDGDSERSEWMVVIRLV